MFEINFKFLNTTIITTKPASFQDQAGQSQPDYSVKLLPYWTWRFIGPIPWGHSGPLCHALSLSWTSIRRRRATVPLATPGEWA